VPNGYIRSAQCLWCSGQLVWRRLVHSPLPSHHLIRDTCTRLLPLLEMFCKWELQEDCSNLKALMLRFDSEVHLGSHELGRSLLFMIEHEDVGFDSLPHPPRIEPRTNPFDVVRERLAAVDLALHGLHPQVHPTMHSFWLIDVPTKLARAFHFLFISLMHMCEDTECSQLLEPL
jgi:hypothetical protein